jgi:hypothetical protein
MNLQRTATRTFALDASCYPCKFTLRFVGPSIRKGIDPSAHLGDFGG